MFVPAAVNDHGSLVGSLPGFHAARWLAGQPTPDDLGRGRGAAILNSNLAVGSTKQWRPCTPAMVAGLTDHVWTLREVLPYRVPPWPQSAVV